MSELYYFTSLALPVKSDQIILTVIPFGVNYRSYHHPQVTGLWGWADYCQGLATRIEYYLDAADIVLLDTPSDEGRDPRADAMTLDMALPPSVPRNRIALICGIRGSSEDYRASGFLTVFDGEGIAHPGFDGMLMRRHEIVFEELIPDFVTVTANFYREIIPNPQHRLFIADGVTDLKLLQYVEKAGVDAAFGIIPVAHPELYGRDYSESLINDVLEAIREQKKQQEGTDSP